MELSFQEENNKLLEEILFSITKAWQGKNKKEKFLELYVTGDCNQRCDYCYLVKYGDQIYPKEFRKPELILNNLRILLDYLLENKLIPYRIDLFSGEILGTKLGNQVFDILLEYIQKGFLVKSICIPTNMSFCLKEETIKIIDDYIEYFESLDCHISMSCSMDGLVVDKFMRPFYKNTDKLKTADYYKRIIGFCTRHGYGYHPMISAASLKYQKENYKIWLKILHLTYSDKEEFKSKFGHVMQLMVRNNDWTDDSIKEYIDWLNFLIETDKQEYFDNDNKILLDSIYTTKVNSFADLTYLPYQVSEFPTFSCTIGNMICIRLGDLAICPCHRTSYDKYLFGKFIIENNKIVGIKANNVQLASAIYLTNTLTKPKCNECPIVTMCVKGCLGCQYENTNEIFYPVESVCNLLKVSYLFLNMKFQKMMKESNINVSQYGALLKLDKIVNDMLKKEDFSKWIMYIQNLI